MQNTNIWKFLLTLTKTFASCNIYWVFERSWNPASKLYAINKERKEKVSLKERKRKSLVLRIVLSRSAILGRRDHAIWGWETESDADEWKDQEDENIFFFLYFSCFRSIFIYWPKYGILFGIAETIQYGPVFKLEQNNHVSVLT